MSAAFAAVLVALAGLSQFYRSCLGVIAPELTRDLGLTPEALGQANGAFFVAMGVMQIPVGLLFDRYGPRRTVTALTVLAVAAAAWHAVVRTPGELIAARLLLGFGCSASFMSLVALSAVWVPGPRLATTLSRLFAFSQVGIFLAATPLALVEAWAGWRWAFAGMATLTAATCLAFWTIVRDRPPGAPSPSRTESLGAVLRGSAEVWKTKGLLPILAVHLFSYASVATVLGTWAGPYLAHVHHMDGTTRGNVLLVMAAAQLVCILAIGPLDRVFDTRKGVVLVAGSLSVALLATLALVPALPTGAAVALLIAYCSVTAFSVQIVAHGRTLFPDRLVGRGVTTVNLAQVLGLSVLPLITGPIVGAFPAGADGSAPDIAYRAAFGVIAALLAAGLALYSTSKDAKPSEGR